MIYTCSYCGRQTRPRDNVECDGNRDAPSHGICARCRDIAMSDFDLSVDEIRRRSLATAPACQRIARPVKNNLTRPMR